MNSVKEMYQTFCNDSTVEGLKELKYSLKKDVDLFPNSDNKEYLEMICEELEKRNVELEFSEHETF